MAGVVPKEMAREQAKETYMRRIDEAAAALAVHGLTLMIEPINPFDMPGYFLTDIAEAAAIIRDLGRPNIKLQYDIYHMARLGFDVAAMFAAYEPLIAHVQFADAPGRHEPGTGALPYREMFAFCKSAATMERLALSTFHRGKAAKVWAGMRNIVGRKEEDDDTSRLYRLGRDGLAHGQTPAGSGIQCHGV